MGVYANRMMLGQIIWGLVVALSLVGGLGTIGFAQTALPQPAADLLADIQAETRAAQQAVAAAEPLQQDLRAQLQALEALQAQEQQDFQRLQTLVDTYGSSAHVAQRLHLARTRLAHERARQPGTQVAEWEAQLQELADTALQLDEKLYRFESRSAERLARLRSQLGAIPAVEQNAHITTIQQAMTAQQAAWRAQAQGVVAQTQTLTDLMTRDRDRQLALDERYRILLAETFWMRDSQPVHGGLIRDAQAGLSVTATRLGRLLGSEWTRLRTGFSGALVIWLVSIAAFVLLPWLALLTRRYFRALAEFMIARDAAHDRFSAKVAAFGLMLLETLVWPLYIAFVVWAWPRFTPGLPEQPMLYRALITGLQWTAFLLWLDLLSQAVVRREGWGMRYLGLPREAAQVIRRTVAIGCLAALLLMVPRYVLMIAPGGPDIAPLSLALARLCFIAFQLVFLILIGLSCRRQSPAVSLAFGSGETRSGWLWQSWPFIHGVIVIGLAGVLALDVQGFCYTSRSLWLISLWALITLLGLLGVYGAITALIQYLIRQREQHGNEEDAPDPTQPGRIAVLHQGQQFAGLMLLLIGVFIIQYLYGFGTELMSLANSVQVLNVSSDAAAPSWLTLGDMLKALLILGGTFLVTRNSPCICEVCLFPHVAWDGGFRYAFLTLMRYAVTLFGLWWALTMLRMNWSGIQWILAAASVGLGFGLQEIVSNFISGLILLIERPVSVGDIVTVGSESGTVTRITIRATFLQNRANQIVIVPNKSFITSEVTNAIIDDPATRIVVPVGVAYGSDLELVKEQLLEAASTHPVVEEMGRPVLVHFRGFGDSSLDWELRFFVPAPGRRLGVTHDILMEIDRRFREHGIEIPFPQRDVHVQIAETSAETPVHSDGLQP
ncbi:MAG: hypothetical protein ETSY1_12965 [Candidatus Entotheonella factor]|uniref:DUF3772 domain-containing protein n=1 Tax=Entotheonella factor TaxID=1429438 RepID=W4LQH9_ENTF1|nr:MAG: hypothetical protein ETSY1_12965 [Candidatus Entotheonella factor]